MRSIGLSATLFVLEMKLYRHEPVGQRQLQSAGTWLCASRLQLISPRSLLCIVYSDMTHIEIDLVWSVFVITSMFINRKTCILSHKFPHSKPHFKNGVTYLSSATHCFLHHSTWICNNTSRAVPD